METHEAEHKIAEMEKDIESLVSMVSELYEKVHRVERVLVDERTIDAIESAVDEHGPEGLFEQAKAYVQDSETCSVSLLQKQFKITYKRAFSVIDALESEGVIAPYRDGPHRVVNQ